jgi:predicted nucleic acid-binding protein
MNLAIVDKLHLLQKQFGEVVIPIAVIEELKLDTDYSGTDKIRTALSEGWIRQESVKNAQVVQALKRELDNGEAEAIALALQLQTKQILIDEREGRSIAKSMGLNPVGVLGILIRAKEEGEIKSLREVLEKLQREAGFYLTDTLMKEILSDVGEK